MTVNPVPKSPGTFSGTWLCTKASRTFRNLLRFSGTFSGTLLNLRLPGTFTGTLLNLTWLCTKAFQTLPGTFSGILLNVTWLCTKASQTFSGTFGTFSGTSLNLTRRLELFWAEDPIRLRCWGIIYKTSSHLFLSRLLKPNIRRKFRSQTSDNMDR